MLLIDFEKLEEYKKDLEMENNLIPLILLKYIDSDEYISNLRKNEDWDNIRRELFSRRNQIKNMSSKDKSYFEKIELRLWLKKNFRYKDIIK